MVSNGCSLGGKDLGNLVVIGNKLPPWPGSVHESCWAFNQAGIESMAGDFAAE